MDLPGLSKFEHQILKKSAELGIVPFKDAPRKRRKASLPLTASIAVKEIVLGSFPATPPPEPPQRVRGTDWQAFPLYTYSRTNLCAVQSKLAIQVRLRPLHGHAYKSGVLLLP